MTNELRKKIRMYVKNRIDISLLIKDVCIKGENLSNAIIKDFSRPDDDISGCNLACAIIGEEGKITNLNRVTAKNINCQKAVLKGIIWLRRADCRNGNFKEAFMPHLDYRYADLRDCDMCGAIFNFGSDKGVGAILGENFFKEFEKQWGVEIRVIPGKENERNVRR